MTVLDPIHLARRLIRCRSVTPADDGAMAVLQSALAPLGFQCHRLDFAAEGTAPVANLYARLGNAGPNFCFAGHTDVVPPGNEALWRVPPFAGEVLDGVLHGRGAADMKAAIAAFVAALSRFVAKAPLKGSISLLITGDEEGPGVNGTRALLGWLKERGETIDHCIVGEPTAAAMAGDTLKIGRRGSVSFAVTVRGIQGHAAYPQQSLNPIPILASLIGRLSGEALDSGTEHFEPSTLAFTTVDVGNSASNVTPAEARAGFNIRFNDLHTPQTLQRRMEKVAEEVARECGGEIALTPHVSGVAFLTRPGAFTDLLAKAAAGITGSAPQLSTGGGTSDARFIKDICPVAELGLPGTTMHKIDEAMPVAEIMRLTDIYAAVLDAYFADQ